MSSPAAPPAGGDGLLLLDKPEGWSSTQALGRAKRFLGLRKAGHTGTLDPFATGLLPLAFGEATKFSRFLIDAPKTYTATLRLGRTSTSGDPEGIISEPVPVSATSAQIDDVLAGFVGVQCQVPPMHSAIHHAGRRLYEFAREGVEVERAARTVRVHRIERVSNSGEKLVISVKCSKGTYIRTLAQDIGCRLGCGAYLTDLRRTEVAGFSVDQAISVGALEQAGTRARDHLLPVECLVAGLPRHDLDHATARALGHGRVIQVAGAEPGEIALFDPVGRLLGVGLSERGGRVVPVRLRSPAREADSPDFA